VDYKRNTVFLPDSQNIDFFNEQEWRIYDANPAVALKILYKMLLFFAFLKA